MIKTMRWVMLLTLMIFFHPASPVFGASEWVEFYTGNLGNVAFYKKVVSKDGAVKYVIKDVFSDKGREAFIRDRAKKKLSTVEYEEISNVQSLNEIDCREKKIRHVSIFYFDKDGKLFSSDVIDNPKWVKIPDNPFFNALIKKACQ